MLDFMLQFLTPLNAFLFVLTFSIVGVIFDLLIENRNPDDPRRNPLINRWRRVLDYFTISKTQEEWGEINHRIFRKVLDTLFDCAKWVLALAGIHALALSTQNRLIGALGWILTFILGAYIGFVMNQWFNVSMYETPRQRVHKWINILMAIYMSYFMTSTIHSQIRSAVDDMIRGTTHSEETKKSKPIKRWSDDWTQV